MSSLNEWKEEVKNLMGDAEKEITEYWEREMVRDLYYRVIKTLEELEKIDAEIEKKDVGSPDPEIREWFKRTFAGYKAILFGGPKGSVLGGTASIFLNKIWDCGIRGMAGFLERQAKEVGGESWSIGVGGGFPLGVSVELAITFKA